MDEFVHQNNDYLLVKRPILANLKAPARLAVALSLVVIGIVLFTMIGFGVAFLVFGIKDVDYLNFSQHLNEPVAINILKLMQAISAIGGFIIPALLFAYLISGNITTYLKMNRLPKGRILLLVILLVLAAGPLINFLAELNSHMHLPHFMAGIEQWMRNSEDEAARITTAFLKTTEFTDLLINLFIVAFLAALGEELLFRGVIQTIMKDWTRNTHLAIWIAAALFSAFHFQFFGFLPRMLLGALLGYLFQWSGSIWLPALAHFTNNAGAVSVSYFVSKGKLSAEAETIGASTTDWLLLVASILITLILLRFIYTSIKKQVKIEPDVSLTH
jgi:uncharacterized protein